MMKAWSPGIKACAMTAPFMLLSLLPTALLMPRKSSLLLDFALLLLPVAAVFIGRALLPLVLLPLLISLIQLGTYLQTGRPIDVYTLMTFSATNLEESSGFATLMLKTHPYALAASLASLSAALAGILLAPAIRASLPLMAAAAVLIGYIVVFQYRYHRIPDPDMIVTESLYGQAFQAAREYYKSFYDASYEQAPIKSLRASGENPAESILVVLGESATKLRMSAYGYARNTTPALSEADVLFRDIVSVGLNTQPNVQAMMTGDVGTISQLHEQDIFRVSRRMGYTSYYVDNNRFVNRDPMYLIARQSDRYFSMNGIGETIPRNDHKLRHDEVVIADFKVALQESQGRKRIIFVHLAGSHFNHDLRYPPEFARYPSHYDNSIAYTDHVMKQLGEAFMASSRNMPAMMIYVSDHGLKLPPGCGLGPVPDNETANYGNDERYFSNMAVPLAFWFNDSFKHRHEDMLASLLASRDKPIDQRFLMWTVADAMGVTMINGHDVGKLSLFSKESDYAPRLNSRGDNIDTLIANGSICKDI